MMQRLALFGYRMLLALLPRWFRDRVGAELDESFSARLTEARTWSARVRVVAHEYAGVLRANVSARSQGTSAMAGRAATRSILLDSLLRDVSFALRAMRRGPGLAVLAVTTLALGVGASTAMFSVIDAVLLRPMPFPEPDRIVRIWPTIEEWRDHASLHEMWQRGNFSQPELADYIDTQRSFDAVAGLSFSTARVPAGGGTERVPIVSATSALFPLLRVTPHLGRLPQDSDETGVVVLSHAYWQARHGGDPNIIGRDLQLNEEPVRVIGVLPREFELVGVRADLWQPFVLSRDTATRRNHFLHAVGRLRDDVSVAQAKAEAAAVLGRLSADDPGHITHRARIESPVADATRELRVPIAIFAGASLLLLGTACANVALLLLGAGADRIRELAVRRALGAHKLRIARQLLIESVVLSLAGAAAGFLVAYALLQALVLLAPEGIPRIAHVALNLRTFAFTAAIGVATGVLVGCLPAFSLSRVDATSALRAGATAPGRGWLQRGVVVLELALATVLLVGAGLLTRTMSQLQQVEPGFDHHDLFTVQLDLPWDRYFGPGKSPDVGAAQLAQLDARVLAALSSIAGIEQIAISSDMPYSDDRGTNAVEPEGYVPAEGEVVDAARRFVSGNYFDVMRIKPLQGRLLSPADDRAGAELVMVVTDNFARHFWPDGRWLDRKVGFWNETYRVVGVIEDTREHDLRGDEDRYKFYVAGRGRVSGNLLIRASLPLATLASVMRERIWSVDRGVVITDMQTMRDRITASIAQYRYRMRLMLAFSVTAALFAVLGVYGVMNRSVARRRRELGVRIALGAARPRILSLVLRDGVRLALVGGAIGIAAALIATRAIESMLWGVPRTDPVTFVLTAGALLLLAMLASAFPASRAAAVEPMSALRG